MALIFLVKICARCLPRVRSWMLFCPTGKSLRSCRVAQLKIFRFTFHPNHLHIYRHPAPTPEGRFAIVTNVGRGMRWTQAVLLTRALVSRTAKPCGLDAPTLASSRWKRFHRRWWQTSPVPGESAEETVKTIAQGRPGVPVNLW